MRKPPPVLRPMGAGCICLLIPSLHADVGKQSDNRADDDDDDQDDANHVERDPETTADVGRDALDQGIDDATKEQHIHRTDAETHTDIAHRAAHGEEPTVNEDAKDGSQHHAHGRPSLEDGHTRAEVSNHGHRHEVDGKDNNTRNNSTVQHFVPRFLPNTIGVKKNMVCSRWERFSQDTFII